MRWSMHAITSNEREAANRAEVTALLIRSGFRVYRPEADVQGEDLVLRHPAGALRSVQLKSRPYVEQARYGGRGIWMLFPNPKFCLGRDWFLIKHDELYDQLQAWHGQAPGWAKGWSYSSITPRLCGFLEPYSQMHWATGALATVKQETEGAEV